MANEIDLYNDLEKVRKFLKKCPLDEKDMWEKEEAKILKEMKDTYPDMFWGDDE
jgi:hypothetical protein